MGVIELVNHAVEGMIQVNFNNLKGVEGASHMKDVLKRVNSVTCVKVTIILGRYVKPKQSTV
mgnify:CR=1 FL=1